MRLKIPIYAKRKAKSALLLNSKLPKSLKFGLTKMEARKLGITSGTDRAKQIIRNKYLSEDDIKAVCRFSRFLYRTRTLRTQGVIDLWGGEMFIIKCCNFLKRNKK
jgi:hypothetical protein